MILRERALLSSLALSAAVATSPGSALAAPSPPSGWARGEPLPATAWVRHARDRLPEICARESSGCFEQHKVDTREAPRVVASFDVPFADLPLAVAKPVDPSGAPPAGAPRLSIRDDHGREVGTKGFGADESLRYIPQGVAGVVTLNDETEDFNPWSLEFGLHHFTAFDGFTMPKHDGPFSFLALAKHDPKARVPFDRVEGDVDHDLHVHVSGWIHGEAAPVGAGLFHAVKLDEGRIVLFAGESVHTLSVQPRDASETSVAMVFPSRPQEGVLIEERVPSATRWDLDRRILADVGGVRGDAPVLRIRVILRPSVF